MSWNSVRESISTFGNASPIASSIWRRAAALSPGLAFT
jgi:hypothetical protein